MTSRLVRRVPFDESWLATTARWLSDEDLTTRIMSGAFDPEQQRAWFESLPDRTDYAIWGMEYDGARIGVMGIKGIGVDDGAEYFMYIGERDYWGRGIAGWALEEIAAEVASRGLRHVYGRIGKHNDRSMAVHLRLGFTVVRDDGDTLWLSYPAARLETATGE